MDPYFSDRSMVPIFLVVHGSLYLKINYEIRPVKIKNLFYLAELFFFRPRKIKNNFYLADFEKKENIIIRPKKKENKIFLAGEPSFISVRALYNF